VGSAPLPSSSSFEEVHPPRCALSSTSQPASRPPHQLRRRRRRFRTASSGRSRAPSIGSIPGLAARAGSTSHIVHTRGLAPHPVARREPFPRAELSLCALRSSLVKGWWVASSYLDAPRRPPCRCQHESPRGAARKMRLTDFCNRLPSRAPLGLLDPRTPPRHARLAACHDACAGSPWACAPRRGDWDLATVLRTNRAGWSFA